MKKVILVLAIILCCCGEIKAQTVTNLPTVLRVGLMDGQKEVCVSGTNLSIKVGTQGSQLKVESGNEETTWRLVKGEFKPAKLLYWPVVKTLPQVNGNNGVIPVVQIGDVIKEWGKRGYQVTIKEMGRRLQGRDLSVSNQCWWACLPPAQDLSEANKLCQRLAAQGYKPWIYTELVSPSQGTISLFDAQGVIKGVYQPPIRFISQEPIKVYNVEYGKGYYWAGKQDRRFSGIIEINLDQTGNLVVINEVEIEEYLCSVVPCEIDPSSGLEALKAQAVAARGETLAKLGLRHLADLYDFCADVHCQTYGGIDKCVTSTSLAVKETSGQVLMFNGQIVDTVYCGNCGGHTENNENVWASPSNPCLKGVADFDLAEVGFSSPITEQTIEEWLNSFPAAYCSDSQLTSLDKFRWLVTYSAAQLNELVNKREDLGEVRDIILLERGVSGRLKAVKIIGSKKEVTIYKELPIREIFGGLKSAMFILTIKRDSDNKPFSFEFTGGGWGHGVGMCQVGAKGMAKRGKGYLEILQHYFSYSQIKTIY